MDPFTFSLCFHILICFKKEVGWSINFDLKHQIILHIKIKFINFTIWRSEEWKVVYKVSASNRQYFLALPQLLTPKRNKKHTWYHGTQWAFWTNSQTFLYLSLNSRISGMIIVFILFTVIFMGTFKRSMKMKHQHIPSWHLTTVLRALHLYYI